MPYMVGGGSHHRIDDVSPGTLQEVSHHPVVRFQVADDRLNAGSLLELLPGLRLLIADFGDDPPGISAITTYLS